MDFNHIYNQFKEISLFGKYITLENIEPLLNNLSDTNSISIIGKSVQERSIFCYQKGSGKTRILMWSQMHGNESTTTRALFDFFNFLESDSDEVKKILGHFSFCIIPMLNPDGAKAYTRVNANGIDLNRDANDLSQPESVVLRKVYDEFNPDYCYNLHDQRTIFGVGFTNKPATVSFLAPSYNEECEWNDVRLKAIGVIVGMNKVLQGHIPEQVGRFDDSFNSNCVGDTFQFLGTPTVLFEAGHFQNDYNREETRKFIFIALLSGLQTIYENVIVNNVLNDYLNIPQNNSSFFDFVYKNVKINYDSSEIITNFAAQYNEELINNTLFFNAFIVKIGDLENNFGHFEFNALERNYWNDANDLMQLGQKADFYLGKDVKIVNGSIVN